MCGICGVVQIDGSPRSVIAPERLDLMTDVMRHRGPNDRGTLHRPGVALGVRRLSIVDVEGGHQPISNEDGNVWAVHNGELYNHSSLRTQLRREGHVFHTECDTEVIPHLYERYGAGFAAHLRGMFGIAIWDGARRRAVLARDRLGIKPLYFACREGLLLFSSELKSLLSSGFIEPELDYEAIDAYLTLGFVPAPRTPLRDVSKLMPGHVLVVADGDVRLEQYWEYPKPTVNGRRIADSEHLERLMAGLDESVALRLMSDVPLGAMLSGGLDSSLIVALMAKRMAEPVKTFSIGFAEAGPANELEDARFVANALGTDHHEIELSMDNDAVDLAELVWHLDEPVADLSSLGFLALSGLAAKHVTVALSGQGADEVLGGYSRYRHARIIDGWDRLPSWIRRTTTYALDRSSRFSRVGEALGATDRPARFLAIKSNLPAATRERLARGPLLGLSADAALTAVRSRVDNGRGKTLESMLYLDAQLGLVDDMLHYFDRMSMARSLEVRVPFLDHELVELCAGIPPDLKVRGSTTKYLLKQAAAGLVPDRIIHKPKVGFFNSAVSSWFKNAIQTEGFDYLLGAAPRYEEFLDRAEIERLVRTHDGRDSRGAHLLLSILILEVWLSSVLPRAVGGSTFIDRKLQLAM
jgi:asparagine synthase (glutamine-hydrolysing)